jgi:Ca-activated chloride channel family protein
MLKRKLFSLEMVLFLVLPIFFMACSSGGGSGGSGESNDSVAIAVEPQEYDFGIVTMSNSQASTQSNSPAPLEVKIQNISSRNVVNVSNIALSDTDNFALDLSGGSNPCDTLSPTIVAGEFCSVEVLFQPQNEASYSANLRVETTDDQAVTCRLSGVSEAVTTLNVRINQVESDLQCPNAAITAYVSITDQGGYPITGLLENNFLVVEDSIIKNIEDLSFVSQVTTPISVALVMDYSGSINDYPEIVSDMENAVADFVEQLGNNDEAEIEKFAEQIEVVQAFTSDKNLLKNAIYETVDLGRKTALYDAAYLAVEDTASRIKERKAVIIVTDGEDYGGDAPISSRTLDDVINLANEESVPIFTVGLGEEILEDVLIQMANDTGGQYFDSPNSDNLLNIYKQLSDILFEDQYIIQYISALAVCETADLTIEVESQAITGEDTKEITPCCP